MRRIGPKDETVKVIDLSHWDPASNFALIKATGIQACFFKATEGLTNRDTTFDSHWFNCKKAGIIRGAYHFFHPSMNAKKQAAHFVEMVHKFEDDDLPPVLDLETMDGMSASNVWGSVATFLDEMKRLTGRLPIIYGSPYFINDLGHAAIIGKYPLWVAHYQTSAPMVPDAWPTWDFWQYTETGKIPGVKSGAVDVNYFNGNLDQLKKFIAGTKLPAVKLMT